MREYAAVYDEDDDVAFVVVREKTPQTGPGEVWKVFSRIDSEDNAMKIANAMNTAEVYNFD